MPEPGFESPSQVQSGPEVGRGAVARPGRPVAAPVLAIVRFRLPAGSGETAMAGEFAAGADRALTALGQADGYRAGRLARAVDDPDEWVLVTEWDGPGAWRRALGRFDVKIELTPLLVHAVDAPGAFEVLVGQDSPAAASRRYGSALAPDAATAAPGH
ncbi:antibiotic biosynthesis monooxygenase family protein [Pseudofrankia sp. BMG5.36]|uniref:antibiotic biosynthesis monooxygenase family protein n=1 Tax=Pseudofrankia sp. BMG5.36 TaxID=1834512 RepID=UPI0009F6D498|nr:antibiotic biosynthesis monooxygenase family protein [Pseudofrankia sp. BMG5.36]